MQSQAARPPRLVDPGQLGGEGKEADAAPFTVIQRAPHG